MKRTMIVISVTYMSYFNVNRESGSTRTFPREVRMKSCCLVAVLVRGHYGLLRFFDLILTSGMDMTPAAALTSLRLSGSDKVSSAGSLK
jgi:hypothetical protein